MIELREVYKSFGKAPSLVKALDGVSLVVPRGSVTGIIGLSGAGKSTLVRCINMLERPDSGSVWLDGEDLTGLSGRKLRRARRKIGMIFQHFNLLSSASVIENVAFPLRLCGTSKHDAFVEARRLLRMVGLEEKEADHPQHLSGGQKQRVGIARALALHPQVLLCDEATSALDPSTTESILSLLSSINEELGLTVVMITHEMAVVRAICDRVAILEAGRLAEEGPVLDLVARPHSLTARRFMQAGWNGVLPSEVAALVSRKAPDGKSRVTVGLTFVGKAAGEPLMAELVSRFSVTPNILIGDIQNVRGSLVGRLLVQLDGRPQDIDASLEHLAAQDVVVEVLKG